MFKKEVQITNLSSKIGAKVILLVKKLFCSNFLNYLYLKSGLVVKRDSLGKKRFIKDNQSDDWKFCEDVE